MNPVSMEHKNSSTPESYTHKKFSALKRKRSQDEELEEASDDVIFVMEEKPAKRGLFRPWLDEPQAALPEQTQVVRKPQAVPAASSAAATAAAAITTTYHANMVRSQAPRLRCPKAQQRRDRNTLACLLSRRARKAKQVVLEEQYEQYRLQHEANLQQQIRLSLYYVRALQQATATTRAPLPNTPHHMRQCWWQ